MDGYVFQDHQDTICDIVHRRADIHPDSPAFVSEDQAPLTYRGLAQAIDDIGHSIVASGFGRGDRLAIVHPGGAEMATLLLGVMNVATALPLRADNNVNDLRTQIQTRRAAGVIIEADTDTPAREIAGELGLPILEIVPAEENITGLIRLRPGQGKGGSNFRRAESDDVAYVISTSGTTSRGKLVPMRHRHCMARAITQATMYGITDSDRSLNFQSFYFNSGITNVCCTLYVGGSVIIKPKFRVEEFYRLLDALRPTWFAGSFTFQQYIYAEANAHEDIIRRSSLRFIRTMSGHLDPEIGAGIEKTFGVPLINSYGSTEAGRITCNPQPPGLRKPGTVGPIIECEAFVADQYGNRLAAGERGEIWVRGDQVFDGYEDDPEENAASFIDGWYRTGDEGFFDADGYLTLTGRIKELINRGGEKVSPQEVDKALSAHPDVREAATFGIPHPTLGEIVGAAIVPMPGKCPDKQELIRFLSDRLTRYKIPRAYHFIDEIPKGTTGKIQRQKLAELFTAPNQERPR